MNNIMKEDLTQGNIYKVLLSFAFPFFLANLIQNLYGTIDILVIGRVYNQVQVSAVSLGAQITQLLISMITGLTMGGTILIAQYIGIKKNEDVMEVISTAVTMFLLVGLVFMICMFIFTPTILDLIKTPIESLEYASQYVYICSGGILFIFGYNAISAILRGLGDSKTPMLFALVACLIHIILSIVLVVVFHLGAAGSAISNVCSQGLSFLLSIRFLKKHNIGFDFSLSSFHIFKEKAFLLFKVGLPISLQETVSSISFLCIASIINIYGVTESAAFGICTKFEGFAMLASTAIAAAISTIAAQNIGAGNWKRAKKALWTSIAFALSISMIFFLWAGISPNSIMTLFNAKDEVVIAGAKYLYFYKFDFLLVAFGFTLNGFFNGCGRTFFAMVNGVAASVFIRIPLAYIFSVQLNFDLKGIGAAMPIATIVTVIAGMIYYKIGKWKESLIN